MSDVHCLDLLGVVAVDDGAPVGAVALYPLHIDGVAAAQPGDDGGRPREHGAPVSGETSVFETAHQRVGPLSVIHYPHLSHRQVFESARGGLSEEAPRGGYGCVALVAD